MKVDPVELAETIAAHPWRSVAVAFAAGACVALADSRRPIVRAAASTFGAVAVAVFRDAATAHARSWIDARARTSSL